MDAELNQRAVTFGYDGDQRRIRKTTPDQETLYLGELYVRVTQAATGVTDRQNASLEEKCKKNIHYPYSLRDI